MREMRCLQDKLHTCSASPCSERALLRQRVEGESTRRTSSSCYGRSTSRCGGRAASMQCTEGVTELNLNTGHSIAIYLSAARTRNSVRDAYNRCRRQGRPRIPTPPPLHQSFESPDWPRNIKFGSCRTCLARHISGTCVVLDHPPTHHISDIMLENYFLDFDSWSPPSWQHCLRMQLLGIQIHFT